jgi:hypothetical protein
MDDVESATTDCWGLVKSGGFGLHQHSMPQATAPGEQSGGKVVFHFLPDGLNLRGGETLLEQGETQRVSQFETVKNGKGQRRWIRLSPQVSPD